MSNEVLLSPDVVVTFYDNFVPSLKDGEYTVTIEQSLVVDTLQTQNDGGNTNIPGLPQDKISQKFIVRGPRFILNPVDIHRVFPAKNSVGVYDNYLPMVILNKRALPWERQLSNLPPDFQNDKDLYPWVALLVFSEEELIIPQPTVGAETSLAGGDQKNPAMTASFPLDKVVKALFKGKETTGPPPGIFGPKITLEDDEDPNQIYCNVIDISVEVFASLIPTIEDSRFLTHVRQVSTANKEPLKLAHDGWFSTVIANRFAIPPPVGGVTPQRNIVHLVSLEGLESQLGMDAPVSITDYQKIRLISLCHWTFTCLPDPQENFRQLALNLISLQHDQGTHLLLQMPIPALSLTVEAGTPQSVATRLQCGYVPLSYATRTGEQTFAWYRGPFSPVVTTTFLDVVPFNSSEAMVYDPGTGLFDQSYAVAFQTGRSLALANQTFSTNLLQWRRTAHSLVDLLMEYIHSPHWEGILQQEHLLDANGNLINAGIADLAAMLDTSMIASAFKNFLATDFHDNIAKNIGKVGSFDPSDINRMLTQTTQRVPVFPADLSQLMQAPAVVALLHYLSGFDSIVGQFNQTPILPEQVIEWLAQTALLYQVPFNNLAPNVQMLPQESIRFFYIDQNWIDALIDGALSVGNQSSRDLLFNRLMRDKLHTAVDKILPKVRDVLRNVSFDGAGTPPGTQAGFILRSALVSGWPGLEIRAWSSSDGVNPMKPLRLDRVAPDIMIVIFPDIPVKVEINEPSEGLVFGFEDEGIALRYLPGTEGETAANIGSIITPETPRWLTPDEINQVKRSLPITQPPLKVSGEGGLVNALQNKFLNPQPKLTPASLAVEMVCVPEQILFLPPQGYQNEYKKYSE